MCRDCDKQFQSKKRKGKLQKKLWNEYVHGKQTAGELGDKYGKSRQWIAGQLSEINVGDKTVTDISPRSIVAVADTTFFKRSYGITIFREPNLKENLIWKEVRSETPGQYRQLRNELELRAFTLKAVVLDGKRGVRQVFSDIPVQMCQFHQVAIVIRYITRRPKLEASKELKDIVMRLTSSTEKEFTELLNDWQKSGIHFSKKEQLIL